MSVLPAASAPLLQRRPWLVPLALLLVGCAVHGAWLTRPLSVVFDEVYFGRYALLYLKPEDYFDLHPPLGKLIFAAMAWLLGLNPGFPYGTNGLPLPDVSYTLLRLPAHLAGVMLPLALYGVARELRMSVWAAFVVGLLAALDNALLVMSRTVQLDVLFMSAGFGALWAYLRHRRSGSAAWFFAAVLLGAVSFSIKWTGLAFLGLVGLLEVVRLVRQRDTATLARLALMVVLPALFYLATFAIHFAIVDRAGGAPATGFLERFFDLNTRMFDASRNTMTRHPYSSHWYDWPFMMRTVDFWAQYNDPLLSRIYLLGNPVVWWSSAYCMLYLLVNFVPKLPALLARSVPAPATPAELFIVAGYLMNMLPFTQIKRVMFLYHYLPALCFAILAVGLLLDRSGRHARWLGGVLLVLAGAAFVYFAPLSYGLEITREQFDARFWVGSWR